MDKPTHLQYLAWPAARLGEATTALARKSSFSIKAAETPILPKKLWSADDEAIGRWLDAVTLRLGIETEPVTAAYAEIEQMVRKAGPAIFRLPENTEEGEFCFLVLLKGNRRGVAVLGPDLKVHHIQPALIRSALCKNLEEPWLKSTNQLLTEAGVPEERRVQACQSILHEQLGLVQVKAGWLLRLSPGATMWQQTRRKGLFQPLMLLFGSYIVQLWLRILAWVIIGWAVLQSHLDPGWLLVWALLLFSAIPFQVLVTLAQNWLAIDTGGLFKQRLLYGSLHLEPEEIRHQGAGQFLGRVMEAEAVELLALGGGFMAVLALLELALAGWILSLGSGGGLHTLLLLSWIVATALISWRYYRRNKAWTDSYQQMTNDLVEQMVGHRTRLAQEDYHHWHDDEDHTLAQYLKLSGQLDQIGIQLNTFIPRGWLMLALTGIAYGFITSPNSIVELAISLGGILLAYQALNVLMMGIVSIIDAMQAWRQVEPIFQAANRYKTGPSLELAQTVAPFQTQGTNPGVKAPQPDNGQPVLIANDLVFRYRPNTQPILEECNLRVQQGDRLLLAGPSGGGKSTFAALLAGLRPLESGLLLLWGFDRQTMGTDEWRRRVVVAPQFHENYILTETFAFNLLMGRRWPPLPADLTEAETVCRELGLGDLLERMPSGFQQMIGESGWQLSHGERSRLYIARALLQQADFIILDESFAALDPENLERTLGCVLKRASTLLVIGHS